jgi:hypothetical protein
MRQGTGDWGATADLQLSADEKVFFRCHGWQSTFFAGAWIVEEAACLCLIVVVMATEYG